MKIGDLQKGHAATLAVSSGAKSLTFNADIKELAPDFVLLSPIVINGKAVGFNEQCSIDFLYTDENKVYTWNDIAVQLVRFKGGVYHKAELHGEGSPCNRRGAFRVYFGEEMTLVAFTNQGPVKYKVLLKDVSATGMGFFSTQDWDVSHIVRLMLPLSNASSLALSAKIVRKMYSKERQRFFYGCHFVEPNQLLSQYLAKLQIEKQRERRLQYK